MTARLSRLLSAALWLTGLAGVVGAVLFTLVARRWFRGATRAVLASGVDGIVWAALALGIVGLALVLERDPPAWLDLPSGTAAAKLLATAVQLGLVVLLLRAYNIEHDAFRQVVLPLLFFGFLAHHGLADRFRLPFFVLLSVSSFAVILGPRGGLVLVTIGLALIAICHLPIAFAWRTALLVAAAALLAVPRAGLVPSPVPQAAWPLVGSFFMFRTACYLYDLRHARAPAGVFPTLGYFFMLPNVAFLLFPVVDFSTMKRTRYADDAFEVYQRGLRLLLRGAVYLLLYRAVYRYLVIPAAEVTDAGELARYLVSNFLLLLQVLGQLDLAVGMLLLFGFDLPEINALNLFAPGFAHFWRRTNRYWREFITKLVYYPLYFRLRGLGATARILVALALAFVVSATLHWYQWFWLRGTLGVSVNDTAFWLVFGSLLLVNVYLETGQKQRVTMGRLSPAEIAIVTVKSAATFVTVSVLWALWTAPSLRDWTSLMRYAGTAPRHGLEWTGGVAALLAAYGLSYAFLRPSKPGSEARRSAYIPRWAGTTALTLALGLTIVPPVTARLGARGGNLVRNLRSLRLNRFDDQELVRGYYENLSRVSVASPELWRLFQRQKSGFAKSWVEEMGRPTNDLRVMEHAPGVRIERASGAVTTNRWGMRDRDYEREKAPGTYRAALLGGSYLVGRDVPDGTTFEALVEDRLNRERGGAARARYELLNLGVSSYGPLESLVTLERKALDFRPDSVWYVAVEGEVRRPATCILKGIRTGTDLVYPEIKAITAELGLAGSITEEEAQRRLRPRWEELLSFCYTRMVRACRERGALPVWVYLPPVDMEVSADDVEASRRLALQAGFVVLDLSDVYGRTEHARLRVTPENHHPNQLGHQLIADGLYRAVIAHERELGLVSREGAP